MEAFKSIRELLNDTFKTASKEAKLSEICPVCNGIFALNILESHVNGCLNKNEKKNNAESKRTPIPKPVFNLMKDLQIKKSLSDYGLPTIGDRPVILAAN